MEYSAAYELYRQDLEVYDEATRSTAHAKREGMASV
jgi:hypothetical protein